MHAGYDVNIARQYANVWRRTGKPGRNPLEDPRRGDMFKVTEHGPEESSWLRLVIERDGQELRYLTTFTRPYLEEGLNFDTKTQPLYGKVFHFNRCSNIEVVAHAGEFKNDL